MPEPPSPLVLHLSDLHFGPYSRFANRDANQLGSRFSEAIKTDIERNNINVPISLVIVTGDVAEAGLPRQYQIAQDFFESLATSLRLEHERFVFVPGNHDVSWPACRRVEADQEEESFDNDELRRRIDEAKFNNFDSFLESFIGSGLSSNKFELGRKGYVKTFEDLKTSVAVLNSCEAESHRSTDHRGLLSEPQAQALMSHWDDRKLRSYLKVVAIHHNPVTTVLANIDAWKDFIQKQTELDSELIERYATDIIGFDGRNYLNRISADCEVHLVLHGHHHAADEHLWSWKGGRVGHTHVLSAGSGTLIPEKLPRDHPNTVRLILLDRKSNELKSWTLKYDPLAETPGYVEPGSFISVGSAPYRHLLSAAKSITPKRKTTSKRKKTSAKAPGKSAISANSIMECIRHGRLSFDQKRRIGLAALQEYYGGHTAKKDSYFNYVIKYFLDWSIADTSIWREDVFSDIAIAQAKKPKPFADRGLLVGVKLKLLHCDAVPKRQLFHYYQALSL